MLFNPSKSFLHLRVVQIVIGAVIFFSILSAIIIILNDDLIWSFTSNGFNTLLVIFRLPLGLLATAIPIVALLAANHRSEQTKEQIKVTTAQNNFSNYYKHLEEFTNYSKTNFEGKNNLNIRYMHKKIYPFSHEGNYSICNKLIELFKFASQLPQEIYDKYPNNLNENMEESDYQQYNNLIHQLALYLNSDSKKHSPNLLNLVKYKETYFELSLDIINELITICKILEKACHFTTEFESPLKNLLGTNFLIRNLIPEGKDHFGRETTNTFSHFNNHLKSILNKMKVIDV